jgi:hypothetical protein
MAQALTGSIKKVLTSMKPAQATAKFHALNIAMIVTQ